MANSLAIQLLDEELYVRLPAPLRRGVEAFHTEFEQQLFLYGAITVSSGLFNKAKGKYFQRDCFSHLFFLALAGPAQGKSALLYAGKLSQKVHEHFLLDSQKKAQEYQRQLKEYNAQRKRDTSMAPPVPKPFRIVHLPVNCTSAKLFQQLAHNQEGRVPQILISSEIDGLTVNGTSEWPVISELLRKIYHSEPITYARKTTMEHYEISDVSMGVALSGTPDQLYGLIKSAQNGLFSRFLVLQTFQEPTWTDVRPCEDCESLTDIFDSLSFEFFDIWKFMDEHPFEFLLQSSQWDKLNEYCELKLQEIVKTHGEDASSIVKRHGLMVFKVAMTLTCFRRYEWKYGGRSSYCSDTDLEIALAVVNQSLRHSLSVYQTLPASNVMSKGSYKEQFYSSLANSFERKEALETGRQLGISNRTVDRCLKDFVSAGRLQSITHGRFCKI